MLLFFLILFPFCFHALYIFDSHSKPSLFQALPTIYLQYNETQTLNLQEYFHGFNLSFLFTDFRNPYFTFSYQSAYIFSEKKLFQSGFKRFLFISNQEKNEIPNNSNESSHLSIEIDDISNETRNNEENSRNAIILTENQQIYSITLSEINEEISFNVKDFVNLPNLLNCSNIILLNPMLFLVDCYNKSDNQGVFLTFSLDTEQKILNNLPETYNNPPFINNEKREIYVKCVKKFKYSQGLLFRFCPNIQVSGVLEVFSEKTPGIFEFFLKIDANATEFELFIQDFEIYQVKSQEDFELFILDELVGPCTVIYQNNSLVLKNDFPLILGEKAFFMKLITSENEENVLVIATSHYLHEISLENTCKNLKNRMNFGINYPIIFNIDYNKEHYFVQLMQENTEFLLVFSRNSMNTNLLYKLPLNPNEEFRYFSLFQSKNLILYNNKTKEYRFLSFFPNKITLSCCKTPVFFDSSGFYNKTIEFFAYNSAEETQEKSSISAKLRISVSENPILKEDFTGLRFFVISPKTFSVEKEFFFKNNELPSDFKKNNTFSQCFQEWLMIGIHENEANFPINNENSVIFSSGKTMDFYLKSQIKLPMMKLKKLTAKFDENDQLSYENPFILGFYEEFDEKPLEISLDSEGKITRNYGENDSFLIETKLVSCNKTVSINLFPDFSSISLTFYSEFLMNLMNNITHLDLNHENSLNLDGFFNGFAEDYSYIPQYSNNTLLLQKYIEKINRNCTSFLNKSDKTLFYDDFAFIFSENSIEMLRIPPLSPEFKMISFINLSEISSLFDFCSEIYQHETYSILVAICQSNSAPLLPKRLVFLSFNAFGFEKILKQTPIPEYIRKINSVFFIENALFLIEKIPGSMNESIIHVFSINYSDISLWNSKKNQKNIVELGFSVSDMFFMDYRLLTAESFDVDYLIFEHLQMKILGEIADSFVIGLMLSDYKRLYYTEFLLSKKDFIGEINKFQIFSLEHLLSNFSHEIQKKNSFIWMDCDEIARFGVIIYNDFRLLEVRFSRFDLREYEIIREFQSFYDCFHKGKFVMNERFLLGICEVVSMKNTKEILIEFYVKNKKNFSNVLQTLSFKAHELANFELKNDLFVISLKNGSFLLYQLKEWISLIKSEKFKGNSLLNGSFIAKNRYSSASVFIQIKPEFFVDDEIDILFIFLVLIPIIAIFFGFFALNIAISWNKRKRKEVLYGKYFKGSTNLEFYKEISIDKI